MSVSIMYRQKMNFNACVRMVGFPKYSLIYIDMHSMYVHNYALAYVATVYVCMDIVLAAMYLFIPTYVALTIM